MCIRDSASAIVETPWVNVGYSAVGVGKRYYLSQNIPENEDVYKRQVLKCMPRAVLRVVHKLVLI